MKHICIGITAHVDAGKTTLSEAMLYQAGALKKLGRVDHQDAFLDTFALERARGITIFSKQAEFSLPHTEITLLDTPGHVDFSAEMERTLQVLDCAVLVISGTDGVQAHTETLSRQGIPTFLFINKMDLDGADRNALLQELKSRLDSGCVDFTSPDTMAEELAVCDEGLLEQYLETGMVDDSQIAQLVAERKAFPCYFGSALRLAWTRCWMVWNAIFLHRSTARTSVRACSKSRVTHRATACHISKSPAVRCPCASSFRAARTAAGRKK